MSTKKKSAKKPAPSTAAGKREREMNADELKAKRTEDARKADEAAANETTARQGFVRGPDEKTRQGSEGTQGQEGQRPRRSRQGSRGGGPANGLHGNDRGHVQEGVLDFAGWRDAAGNSLFGHTSRNQDQGKRVAVPEN